MYEDITYDLLVNRSLARVDPAFDTREGGPIHTPVASVCVELQNMYIALDGVLNETFADTASREYLIKRASERGITPSKATYAVLKGKFDIAVDVGSRFTCGSLSYKVIELINDVEHTYKLQCEIVGTVGNSNFGNLIPIDYIQGLTSAELTELLIPGEDEEGTEDLRSDYFESYDSKAFGGNRADYKNMFKDDISGVGGIKIYRVTESNKFIKIVVITSTWEKPTSEFIDSIQEQVDPLENQGEGIGLAPIGHKVVISSVNETEINISTNLTYQGGYSFDDVKDYINTAIDEYFIELKKTWSDNDNLVVRISQIETR
ncbi:baseplate J/gp47 family protein, partial [Clostridium neonatale]|uniref:baseplate J/gp47 family protein n=1 Tax=Clostridium neonatale TaxID=137838 RepID=UPI003D33D863